MLPFLDQKAKSGSVASVVRKADGGVESEEYSPLQSAAEDLLAAIKSGDAKAVASAWQAGHDICASSYQAPDDDFLG